MLLRLSPTGLLPWLSRHAVVLVAATAAALSVLLVPPDAGYRHYLDGRTLVGLFCLLAVVAALYEVGLLTTLAGQLVQWCRSRRRAVLALVGGTVLLAMLVTNDMALVALLPLSGEVLADAGPGVLARVFVLQAAAANLGGMITPFGSPQNLYLTSVYGLSAGDVAAALAVPFAASCVLLALLALTVPDAPLPARAPAGRPLPRARVAGLLLLFAVTVAVVLRLLPLAAAAVVPLGLLGLSRRALARVDYGLLLTFVLFFVLAGNLSRSPEVRGPLAQALNTDVLVASALASQVVSNVPAAIIGAQFARSPVQLLVGVNVGGVGTLVASLASLIALAEYRRRCPGRAGRFLVAFTGVNLLLLAALLAVSRAVAGAGLLPRL